VPAAYRLRATRANLVRALRARVFWHTTMLTGGALGAVDLALSLAYAALFLVLLGVSCVAVARRAKRQPIDQHATPQNVSRGEESAGGQ